MGALIGWGCPKEVSAFPWEQQQLYDVVYNASSICTLPQWHVVWYSATEVRQASLGRSLSWHLVCVVCVCVWSYPSWAPARRHRLGRPDRPQYYCPVHILPVTNLFWQKQHHKIAWHYKHHHVWYLVCTASYICILYTAIWCEAAVSLRPCGDSCLFDQISCEIPKVGRSLSSYSTFPLQRSSWRWKSFVWHRNVTFAIS